MKGIYIWLILTALCVSFRSDINRKQFYGALSSGSEDVIEKELKALDNQKESSLVLAYKGALTMKSAAFEKGVNHKVQVFKKGAQMLEGEIDRNPTNAEYRFLRLTIQEHAPGILNYNKNLGEDKKAVVTAFSKFEEDLKDVVLDYAAKSKKLRPEDLKP